MDVKRLFRCQKFFLLFLSSSFVHAGVNDDSAALRQNVSLELIRSHQSKLQAIADKHGGTRAVGSEGYKASVDYIEEQLKKAGYEPKRQDFILNFTEDNSEPVLEITSEEKQTFIIDVDFSNMSGAGAGDVNGLVEAVDLVIPSPYANGSTSGCEKEDFAQFNRGAIALIQRGSCSFQVKLENAQDAGASAVIIFNEGNPDRTDIFSGRVVSEIPNYPVFSASFPTGNRLRNNVLKGTTGIKAHLKIDVIEKKRTVQNLIAETTTGNSERVVVVGSHLDSVFEGPGINDNGSGSSTILSIAEKIAQLKIEPKNKLRFIWFAAEELGLLGSRHYVSSLSTQEKSNILAMLNFDMLSSSNYARFVYDGDRFSRGAGLIENIFVDFYSSNGMVSHPTSFDGRSDYGPFIEVGIPAGGLFSGAEGKKSARLAEIYGGTAQVSFDPCYHKRCDDFLHTGGDSQYALALKSLDELSDGATHAVYTLAHTEADLRPKQDTLIKPDFIYQGNLLVK